MADAPQSTVADFPAYTPRSRNVPGPASRRSHGEANRSVVGPVEQDGYAYTYHFTKGIRREKISAGMSLVGMPIPALGSSRYATTIDAKVYLNGLGKRARRMAAK